MKVLGFDPIPVKLTAIERKVAILIGETRTSVSKDDDDRPDAHGLKANREDGLKIDRQGAIAECVLAKHLNVFWCGSVNTFKSEKDVGTVFEVRSIDDMSKRLIVRMDDPDDAYFVSVAVFDNVCYIKGYLLGRDAKKGKWLRDPNDREPAYFVPDEGLKDPQNLKILYLAIRNNL
jgi:hypothetical protein